MKDQSSLAPNPTDRANAAVGLGAFLDSIAALVKQIPSAWVRCELLTVKVGDRFTRMEFIEHGPDHQKLAQASGGCFPGIWHRIEEAFGAAGLRLEPGTRVLVRLKPRLSANYGFSVEVEDIDPSYSLGDLKARAEAIRRKLRAAGLWDGNRSLRQPGDFIRVAVISPPGAAGLGDFRSTVARLERAELVEFLFLEAPFQTAEAPAHILEAMRTVWRQHRASPICALAMIRGGGAAADLAYLAEEKLVDAVCRMPMPVMTGIGHQHDRTLLDEVACMPFDTPSKVAGHILATVTGAASAAERAWSDIRGRALLAVTTLGKGITAAEAAAGKGAHDGLLAAEREVRTALEALRPDARASLEVAGHAANRAEAAALSAARDALRTAVDGLERLGAASLANARATRDRARDGLAEAQVSIRRSVGNHLLLHERSVSQVLAATGAGVPRLLDGADRAVADTLASALDAARGWAEGVGRTLSIEMEATFRAAHLTLDTAERGVSDALTLAEALDPGTVLRAGYAILRAPDGTPLPGAGSVRALPEVQAEMRDGTVIFRPAGFIAGPGCAMLGTVAPDAGRMEK